MKKGNSFALVFVMILILGVSIPGIGFSAEPGGPLRQENRFPALLMVLTPTPESAAMGRGMFTASVSMDYTSVYLNKSSEDWDVLVDMEMFVLTPVLEFRPVRNFALSASIPFVSMTGGFLDGFLEDYHDAGDFPDYGRHERPHNEFAYFMRKNGQDWFYAETGGLHMADMTVSAKYSFTDGKNQPLESALQYSAKLPTGDEKKGLGSGSVDHGVFFLNQYVREPFVYYLNPGVIFPADPKTQGAEVSFEEMYTLFAGIEYMYGEKWSFLAQLNCFTSPFEETGISTLDNNSIEFTFGFVYKYLDSMNFEFAFSEDLSGTLPDFTVHAGFSLEFGL